MISSPRQPLLVVADDDAAERARVAEELEPDTAPITRSGVVTPARWRRSSKLHAPQATTSRFVLAAGAQGAELLSRVSGLFPAARRGLLLPWLGWVDRSLAEVVLRAMARGRIDLYVLRPTRRADEVFHRTISELLQESARLKGEGPAGARVIADLRSPRAHELRVTRTALGIRTGHASRPGRGRGLPLHWPTEPCWSTRRPRS